MVGHNLHSVSSSNLLNSIFKMNKCPLAKSRCSFQCIARKQSHRPLFSALRRRVSVRVSRLYAVFFRSCNALCMNSNAWQSTQGRLSAGMTLPESWPAPTSPALSRLSTERSRIPTRILLHTDGSAIALINNSSCLPCLIFLLACVPDPWSSCSEQARLQQPL